VIAAWLLLVLLTAGDVPAEYRRSDWPWVRAGCQTTRVRVLIRDARSVELDAAKCTVIAGTWTDRYNGTVASDPKTFDVDHVVPLKWVSDHGGAVWSPEQKKVYANDLGYRYHLAAVSAAVNRAKGSRGPDTWRPPNRDAWCAYGRDWSVVLVTWNLTPDDATRAAIRELVTTC